MLTNHCQWNCMSNSESLQCVEVVGGLLKKNQGVMQK